MPTRKRVPESEKPLLKAEKVDVKEKEVPVTKQEAGSLIYLIVCILGIYGSFSTWAVSQERISTTPYGDDLKIFRASNAINTIQSLFAFAAGIAFSKLSSKDKSPQIFPSNPKLIKSYAMVALCQALSSPFSYASLKYVDYVTMSLAKSCKLVPVMAVHLLLYRTKFPAYKYVVVGLVTLGVSSFSSYQQGSPKSAKSGESGNQLFGMSLLGCGSFLDGLYNTTQDQMFRQFGKTGEVSGPQMMVVMNSSTSVFSFVGLVSSPQLSEVLWFLRHHPAVFRDIGLFASCGAVGQIFIFSTLEQFGSLVLVTTTVTRKMISMSLSVVMFNHKSSGMQWFGVSLVFGGIAGEALYKQFAK